MKRTLCFLIILFFLAECKSKKKAIQPPSLDIKDFPIPYPLPSADYVFPKEFVGKAKNFAEMDSRLTSGLEKLGYYDFSYYQIPNGFALVTGMENIDKDAFPLKGDDRWGNPSDNIGSFSIKEYLRNLFYAKKGYYRLVVFLVSNLPLGNDGETPSSNEMRRIVNNGASFLPHQAKYISIDESYRVLALIYEFEKPEYGEAKLLVPSSNPGKVHLERSKILSKLK